MKYFLSLAGLLTGGAVFAHEGHGHTHGFTITHYMVEPEHALALILSAGIILFFVRKYRKTGANR